MVAVGRRRRYQIGFQKHHGTVRIFVLYEGTAPMRVNDRWFAVSIPNFPIFHFVRSRLKAAWSIFVRVVVTATEVPSSVRANDAEGFGALPTLRLGRSFPRSRSCRSPRALDERASGARAIRLSVAL